ncbi:polymorphic toxin-type HINT domain-containing protein [Saccharibacillus brassicae]|uniref:Uncharacterized protein n=1 Tax=Saccharibacillus brassicae TaxID=2583377 RepID=A0A4Y6UV70_SACBS|nr:polymorphic toxin-type HINT domain-containing protein [Saccharibacillus brassicae]QDH21613.1 hypothetical protein FFV09_12625 [Saccharibacillus brassicae]
MSKDENTDEVTYKQVTATSNHETDEIYSIHVGDQVIESTYNHPFWVVGKGWVFVKDLKPGDLLEQSDGKTLEVGTIEIQQRQTTVYNMTVEGFHTYFVSGLGIWVHNDECSEAARYQRYWEQTYNDPYKGEPNTRQRLYTTPGNRSIVDQKINTKTGELYKRETIYDEFGRKIGNNDYTDHGRSDVPSHTNPHYHANPYKNPNQHGPGTPGLHPKTPR